MTELDVLIEIRALLQMNVGATFIVAGLIAALIFAVSYDV